MTVELRWDGKYDAEGKRRSPLRIALPFQTVETINESVQERQRSLEQMFSREDGEGEWRNRLIWGDKKYVLPSLLEEFAGKVNLVYIDPPFFTGTDQKVAVPIPESDEFLVKEPSVIEEAAYRNIWRQGSDSFCGWMYETLYFLRELLSEDGAIFIRFDQYWSHYVKLVADELFGKHNFQNEITLKRIYKNLTNQGQRSLQLATDSLFLYFKTEKGKFYEVEQTLDEERPGYWRRIDDSSGVRTPPERQVFGEIYYPPPGKHFKFGQKKMDEMSVAGRIRINERGRPEYWVEPTDKKPLTSNWTDIASYSFTTGYPTENSEELLERVIRLCSQDGDLVLDCFCGSGTTAAVAEKLNRRWITCDLGRFAIHTARKRLLSIPNVKPFVVQNLGKYERQAWQEHQFGDDAQARIDAYTDFILKLYHAQPLKGFAWLHGVKAGRAVHVGSVDAPITMADVKNIVIEWKRNLGKTSEVTNTGVDVLGWEFALELHETAKQQAAEAGVDLRFLTIPREVLEQKAVEQNDIHFYELAALFVTQTVKKRKLTLELTNFSAPLEYVPAEVRQKITKWQSWIDYWAVDWDFKTDTFHNQWQSYRTRKDKSITTVAEHTYDAAGTYLVQVKVIDILGNDTTRTLSVEVK
jgi:adenine-specific DNA-methyltransferase